MVCQGRIHFAAICRLMPGFAVLDCLAPFELCARESISSAALVAKEMKISQQDSTCNGSGGPTRLVRRVSSPKMFAGEGIRNVQRSQQARWNVQIRQDSVSFATDSVSHSVSDNRMSAVNRAYTQLRHALAPYCSRNCARVKTSMEYWGHDRRGCRFICRR